MVKKLLIMTFAILFLSQGIFAQTINVKVPCTPDNSMYIATQKDGMGCIEVIEAKVFENNIIDCKECFVPRDYGEIKSTTPDKKQTKIIQYEEASEEIVPKVYQTEDVNKFMDRTQDICEDCNSDISQIVETKPEKNYTQKIINYIIECFY